MYSDIQEKHFIFVCRVLSEHLERNDHLDDLVIDNDNIGLKGKNRLGERRQD